MFINCPYCRALVATNPATDEPPEQCPRCAAYLRTALVEPEHPEEVPASAEMMAEDRPAESFVGEEQVVEEHAVEEHAVEEPAIEEHAIEEPAVEEPATGQPAAVELAGTLEEHPAPDELPVDELAAAEFAADEPVADAAGMVAAELEPEALVAAEPVIAVPAPGEPLAPAPDTIDPAPAPPDPPATLAAATPVERRSHKRMPSFVRVPHAAALRPAPHRWRTPVAIALLACALLLQLLLADRASLAESRRWRPLVTGLCAALQCSVPPWREVQAFTLLQRDVRPHPTVPGALRVTASFRNDAPWPQPWPRLALTLSDIDGREAGTRSFTAAEYLGAAPTQQELKSGQTATIAMDVLEPAPRIVAFTFDFN